MRVTGMAELTSVLVGVLLVPIVAVVVRVIAADVNEVVSPGVLVGIGVSTTVGYGARGASPAVS
jgi:hypothetical protein